MLPRAEKLIVTDYFADEQTDEQPEVNGHFQNVGVEGLNNSSMLSDHLLLAIQQTAQPHITDEEQMMMLIESRIHWAIKRNVLRDTVSEDLEWAQCIKNDHDEFFGRHNDVKETRSLQSTPERKVDQGRDKSCNDRIFGSASS